MVKFHQNWYRLFHNAKVNAFNYEPITYSQFKSMAESHSDVDELIENVEQYIEMDEVHQGVGVSLDTEPWYSFLNDLRSSVPHRQIDNSTRKSLWSGKNVRYGNKAAYAAARARSSIYRGPTRFDGKTMAPKKRVKKKSKYVRPPVNRWAYIPNMRSLSISNLKRVMRLGSAKQARLAYYYLSERGWK